MKKHLDELEIKQTGVVISIDSEGKMKRRLFDMGVTPGCKIILKKVAPLGDPIEIRLRGYDLSLRKSEAKTILMEVDE